MNQTLSCLARCSLVLGALPLLWTSHAAAGDRASLAIEQSVVGQSNLFRTEDDEEADGNYEIRPRLRFSRPVGELQYLVEYSPTYDVYFKTNGIDGFDQFGRAELSYSPVPTGKASIRSDFAYYRSIRSNTVESPGGIPEVVPGVSGRVFRAIADAGYEHSFSPTTTGTANLGIQAYEYTTPSNADSLGIGGELGFLHEMGRTWSLGARAFASHRRFDELLSQAASDNTVVHLAPVLRVEPFPTWTIEVEAGPAWVRTDRDDADPQSVARFRTTNGASNAAVFDGCGMAAGQPLLAQCPVVPTGIGDTLEGQSALVGYSGAAPDSGTEQHLTGFARLGVRKEESWGYAGLDYFRAENASSGSGATSIRDSLTGTLQLEWGTRWSLRLRGNWNQRETVERLSRVAVVAGPSGVPAGGGLFFAEAQGLVIVDRSHRNVTQYWGDVTVDRELTDSLSAEFSVRYLYQDRDGSGSTEDHYDNWRGGVMLRYELPHFEYAW